MVGMSLCFGTVKLISQMLADIIEELGVSTGSPEKPEW